MKMLNIKVEGIIEGAVPTEKAAKTYADILYVPLGSLERAQLIGR